MDLGSGVVDVAIRWRSWLALPVKLSALNETPTPSQEQISELPEAGLHNVHFFETDVNDVSNAKPSMLSLDVLFSCFFLIHFRF